MLTIRNPEAERIAHELASQRGQAVDDVVLAALRAEWKRMEEPHRPSPRQSESPEATLAKARAVIADIDSLPILDHRSPDEILGYDDNGAFDGDR